MVWISRLYVLFCSVVVEHIHDLAAFVSCVARITAPLYALFLIVVDVVVLRCAVLAIESWSVVPYCFVCLVGILWNRLLGSDQSSKSPFYESCQHIESNS